MIAGAVFDLDGTLLDSMSIWEHAGSLYLQSLGKNGEPDLGEILYPMSLDEGALYMKQHYALEQSQEEIAGGISGMIRDFYFFYAGLKPGVPAFLEQLSRHGVPMAVATSGDLRLASRALERLEVLKYFTGIFTCAQAGAGKTRPDVYRLAHNSLGNADAADVWVFEDALFAARTVRKAGYRLAAVYDASAGEDWTALRAMADYYMEDFTDFNGFYQKALK